MIIVGYSFNCWDDYHQIVPGVDEVLMFIICFFWLVARMEYTVGFTSTASTGMGWKLGGLHHGEIQAPWGNKKGLPSGYVKKAIENGHL